MYVDKRKIYVDKRKIYVDNCVYIYFLVKF